jgi:hypothetical protein
MGDTAIWTYAGGTVKFKKGRVSLVQLSKAFLAEKGASVRPQTVVTAPPASPPAPQYVSPAALLDTVLSQVVATPDPERLAEYIDWGTVFRATSADTLESCQVSTPAGLRSVYLQFLKQPSELYKRRLQKVMRSSLPEEKALVENIQSAFAAMDAWFLSELRTTLSSWSGLTYQVGEEVIDGAKATVAYELVNEGQSVRKMVSFTKVDGHWLLAADWLPKELDDMFEDYNGREEMKSITRDYRTLRTAAEERARPKMEALPSLKPCWEAFVAAEKAINGLAQNGVTGPEEACTAKEEEVKARWAIANVRVVAGKVRSYAIESPSSGADSAPSFYVKNADELEQTLASALSQYLERVAMIPTVDESSDKSKAKRAKSDASIAVSEAALARMDRINKFFGKSLDGIAADLDAYDPGKSAEAKRRLVDFQQVLDGYRATLRERPDNDSEKMIVAEATSAVQGFLGFAPTARAAGGHDNKPVSWASDPKPIAVVAKAADPNARDFMYGTNDNMIIIGKYTGSGGAVSIPRTINDLPVSHIWSAAFRYCKTLTSVTIPSSVTRIGDSAFCGCTGLTNVTIETGVDDIGDKAFQNCTGLANVVIPAGATNIGAWAFHNCVTLSSITIPPGVISIGEGAFAQCPGLRDVMIPVGVANMGTKVFSSCGGLTNVTISSGVTSIGELTFGSCWSLTSVALPDTLTNLGDSVFFCCTNLASITIPGGVTSIGSGAFYLCRALTSVTIPSRVASVGDGAFQECSRLSGVYFMGNAPSGGWDPNHMFDKVKKVTVYYVQGTSGWTNTWEQRPTALWRPRSP